MSEFIVSNIIFNIPKNSLQYLVLQAIPFEHNFPVPDQVVELINCFRFGVKCPSDEFYAQSVTEVLNHFHAKQMFKM